MKKIITIVLSIIGIVFLNSCKSDSEGEEAPTVLFTANFIDDWLCSTCGEAVIFITDQNGDLLAERIWSGNESFDFELPSDLNTDKITVTTVSLKESHSKEIITYFDVQVGSNWTWKKEWKSLSNNYYQSTLNFENIPNNTTYLFSGKTYSFFQAYPLQETMTHFFKEIPENIYLKLSKYGEPKDKYKWITGINDGDVLNIDLSDMSETNIKTINLPEGTDSFYASIQGFPIKNDRYSWNYFLDDARGVHEAYNSFNISYTNTVFNEFLTKINVKMDMTGNYYHQLTYGTIPNTFTKLNSDFNYISFDKDNFEINTTNNNFDKISTFWYFGGNSNAYWITNSSANTKKYQLPFFSPSVNSVFPDLDREYARIIYSKLYDFVEFNNYKDLLSAEFHPVNKFNNMYNTMLMRRVTPSKKSIISKEKLSLGDKYDRIIDGITINNY